MWVIFVFAAFLSGIILSSGTTEYLKREAPIQQREAKAQVSKFRLFSWAAALYVAENPSVSGAVHWDNIKTATSIPDGLRGAAINPSWKIVADGAGKWVVCAELSELAASSLHKVIDSKVPRQRASDGKVVLTKNTADIETESAKCN